MLYEAARQIAETGGSPPENERQLVALPGVGPYAAAAWLSLHRDRRAVIVDNNVARWLSRMTGRAYDAETRRKRWVRDIADRLTPARAFRDYNYAVLDFTMRICRPRAPLCPECPLRSDCAYGMAQGRGS
jgi:A/G-specific adenine glycosylase